MTEADVIAVVRDGLWVTIQAIAPVMLVAMVVGLTIALLQALTQVQEMTLTFVPKILAVFATILICLPFLISLLNDLMLRIADRISAV